MCDKPRILREPPHFLYKSRFANSGLTPDVHDLATAACQAGGDEAVELIELGLAADEGCPVSNWRIRGDSTQAPNACRYIEAFERHLAEIITKTAARKRVIDSIGQEGLTGSGSRHQAPPSSMHHCSTG